MGLIGPFSGKLSYIRDNAWRIFVNTKKTGQHLPYPERQEMLACARADIA